MCLIFINHFVIRIFLIFEKHFICIIFHFPFKVMNCNYWIGTISITFSLPERISRFGSVLLCLSRILDWESIWASILISFESILMEVNRSELALKTNIKPRWMDEVPRDRLHPSGHIIHATVPIDHAVWKISLKIANHDSLLMM